MKNDQREEIKQQIREAFGSLERPGNWALRGSSEGSEPYEIAEAFKDKPDWQSLDADFLDDYKHGITSALSFFSDEAFRYFLPAYLIADLDGKLTEVDPVFHLCHGLSDRSKTEKVNPRRFGDQTWWDAGIHKFSLFTRQEAQAIVVYLQYKLTDPNLFENDRASIEQALKNYWLERAQD
ncbi:MAG: hypothetical protein A3A33_04790 [Candidatus Yanofskybacteria bacterium RIFCSPLOWO2_01_FULL_49_25]|uniref:Uncharacterized protein n=1 Tax=Candidatus Yanofskybacteria bacterium RIFCSPLOWO2_01_FULL_49_25 TaxID=1802701 RepID=A0A1F8GQA2_9BACT|nr:MAG: hypothetical protein A3A33_04790 [Candidatus Yanofskybacteria bacterium RIFCSPLOWO2_01_FULL_49_25]